jgi:hypothetical protein
MTNSADSTFPARDRVRAPASDHTDTESIRYVIEMLKRVADGTGQAGAGRGLNRLTSNQLHRLEWILCQRARETCASATELRTRCALRQCCLLSETSTLARIDHTVETGVHSLTA